MNKIGIILGVLLITWFSSAIYLSIIYLIGTFADVNPTISKFISAYSLLGLIIVGSYYKYKNIGLDKIGNDLQNLTIGKKEGCKTCKQKK